MKCERWAATWLDEPRFLRREAIVCGTMVLLVNLFGRLFPRIKSVRWWIHIEDIFTIDAELVLDMCMGSDKMPMRSFFIQRRMQGSVKIKEDRAEIHLLWFAINAGKHSKCKISWLGLAYTASTVRFVAFAVLCSVTRPFCRFSRVYEGHLCYKGEFRKVELSDRAEVNF